MSGIRGILLSVVLALVAVIGASMTAIVTQQDHARAVDNPLTVHLEGTWYSGITVQIWTSDGTTQLSSHSNQQGATRTYSVAPGTYDVKLVQGAEVYVVDNVDCTSACTVAQSEFATTLEVDLSGSWHAGITVQLLTDGGDLIWYQNNQHGGVRSYNVLKNTYDINLVQGPISYAIDNRDCTSACTVAQSEFATTLEVDLSGSWHAGITVQLLTDGGDLIWYQNNQHGGVRSYNVLKNTYDINLVQGPISYAIDNWDCTSACTVAQSEFATTLEVDLSGSWHAGITVQLLTDGGDLIWYQNNQHGGVRSYNVLKNT